MVTVAARSLLIVQHEAQRLSLEGVQLHSQALHARTPEPGDQPHQAWELLHGLSDALQSFHCALHEHCHIAHFASSFKAGT